MKLFYSYLTAHNNKANSIWPYCLIVQQNWILHANGERTTGLPNCVKEVLRSITQSWPTSRPSLNHLVHPLQEGRKHFKGLHSGAETLRELCVSSASILIVAALGTMRNPFPLPQTSSRRVSAYKDGVSDRGCAEGAHSGCQRTLLG